MASNPPTWPTRSDDFSSLSAKERCSQLGLALVRDLRELREPSSAEEIESFETDVLAGFVLARASAGLVDSTIRNDVGHLELVRDWFGRPLWEMQPADADAYFGKVLRDAKPSTRADRAAAVTVFFQCPVKWNLRLAAASRGIWKASELQRVLAERGLVISAGKMSGLWSGNPNVVKLQDLDVICAVLGCGVEELLIPEPGTVAAPQPAAGDKAAADGAARPAVVPRG